jgi:hypothetical protein
MVESLQDEIVAQVERITSSSTFATSPRLIQFLRFCVTTSLEGQCDQLKESTIAVSVFGRPPDYDPRLDPIVRVNARRLRDKLERFYETEGQHETIFIEIRKGGYVPRFERRDPVAIPTEVAAESEPAITSIYDRVANRVPATHDYHSTYLWLACLAFVCGIFYLIGSIVFQSRVSSTSPGAELSPSSYDRVTGSLSRSALPGAHVVPMALRGS